MMIENSMKEFLEKVASKSPTPGGGSVAALAGAIACSLASMVCNLTIGKKKYEDVEEKMKEYLDAVGKMKNEFEILIDEDARAFDKVMEAFKLKKNLQEAYKKASLVPLKTAEKSLEAIKYIFNIAKYGNKNAISDAGVAAQMANASFHSALFNVKINLPYIEDEKYRNDLEEKLFKMENEMKDLFNKTMEEVKNRMEK